MDDRALSDLGISSREHDVLALVGERLTNQEIGSRLYISVRTVESHVSSLLRKLDVADRRALAELARDLSGADDDRNAAAPRLPAPLTSFIGRVRERTDLATTLGESRLVTAVGPGGVGKTRLALAVAAEVSDRYADGAWYVDLVPVTDASMVAASVATALGLGEHQRLTPERAVTRWLARRQALLVLDNCEHVIADAAPFVERLLTECPTLTVLATSRARLVVPFERVFAVPGLAVGDDADAGGDAVELFCERAAIGADATAEQRRQVAAICRALEGMALAIELAAARLAALGFDGLRAALDDQLRLLAGGPRAEERHQSLRAALDWSHALLHPNERTVLRRVSVFATPFTAPAAAHVAGFEPVAAGDVAHFLARLADQSLVTVIPAVSGTRYRMLETVRQYCQGQLVANDEHSTVRSRHLDWCLAAGLDCDRLREDEPNTWRPVFDELVDEARAAVSWAATEQTPSINAHLLARLLGELLFARGMPTEAQRRIEQAATFTDGVARVETLALAADAALSAWNSTDIFRLRREAAAVAEAIGRPATAAYNLAQAIEGVQRFGGMFTGTLPPREELDALRAKAGELAGDDPLAIAALAVVDAGARELTDEASARALRLARAASDPVVESAALDQLTAIQLGRGDIAAAHRSCLRRVELLGPPPHGIHVGGEVNDATHMAAWTSIAIGDLTGAHRFAAMRPALPFYSEEGGLASEWLIVCAALAGRFEHAVSVGARFRAAWERVGRPTLAGMSVAPYAMAMVHGLRGDDGARSEWLDIHAEFRRSSIASGVVSSATEGTFYAEWFDATVLLHSGDIDGAVAVLAAEPESFHTFNTAACRQWYAALWAESAVLGGLPGAAGRVTRARSIAGGNPVATAIVARADAVLRDDHAGLAAAAALLDAGCRYQWARTLVLAGGDLRRQGEEAIAAMGATPMAAS